jgi:hypothetical protein
MLALWILYIIGTMAEQAFNWADENIPGLALSDFKHKQRR